RRSVKDRELTTHEGEPDDGQGRLRPEDACGKVDGGHAQRRTWRIARWSCFTQLNKLCTLQLVLCHIPFEFIRHEDVQSFGLREPKDMLVIGDITLLESVFAN